MLHFRFSYVSHSKKVYNTLEGVKFKPTGWLPSSSLSLKSWHSVNNPKNFSNFKSEKILGKGNTFTPNSSTQHASFIDENMSLHEKISMRALTLRILNFSKECDVPKTEFANQYVKMLEKSKKVRKVKVINIYYIQKQLSSMFVVFLLYTFRSL